MLGSISILSIVSLVASQLGSCITPKKMRYLLFATGITFCLFGLFFLASFLLRYFS
jgi:hypothetical protein